MLHVFLFCVIAVQHLLVVVVVVVVVVGGGGGGSGGDGGAAAAVFVFVVRLWYISFIFADTRCFSRLGSTDTGRKVAVVTEFMQGGLLFVAPVWNFFHVTFLAPRFLRKDVSFWFCLLFCLYVFVTGFLNIDPMVIAVLVNGKQGTVWQFYCRGIYCYYFFFIIIIIILLFLLRLLLSVVFVR